MADDLIIERDGHVAVLTLNRPHRLNALGGSLIESLETAWPELDADPDVRAVVVTGAGDRAFCVGADLKETAERGALPTTEYPRTTARQAGVFKPVITAVNGVCAGGGLHFVIDADIVIASETATFLDPHAAYGQVAALEPIGLARKIPLEAVLRMVILGPNERLDAARALALGLVSEVVPHERVRDRALELAHLAASMSPRALQGSLRAVWESLDRGLDDGLHHGWDLIREHWRHPDFLEGPRAFAEGRPAVWTDGR